MPGVLDLAESSQNGSEPSLLTTQKIDENVASQDCGPEAEVFFTPGKRRENKLAKRAKAEAKRKAKAESQKHHTGFAPKYSLFLFKCLYVQT